MRRTTAAWRSQAECVTDRVAPGLPGDPSPLAAHQQRGRGKSGKGTDRAARKGGQSTLERASLPVHRQPPVAPPQRLHPLGALLGQPTPCHACVAVLAASSVRDMHAALFTCGLRQRAGHPPTRSVVTARLTSLRDLPCRAHRAQGRCVAETEGAHSAPCPPTRLFICTSLMWQITVAVVLRAAWVMA